MKATVPEGSRRDPVADLRRGLGRLRWFARGVLGEDAYERYLAHVATHGPGHGAVMTEREFWRDRADRQDADPRGRCC